MPLGPLAWARVPAQGDRVSLWLAAAGVALGAAALAVWAPRALGDAMP